MGVHIEWNPNFERDMLREVQQNVAAKVAPTVAALTCSEHGQHARFVTAGKGWQIEACCEPLRDRVLQVVQRELR